MSWPYGLLLFWTILSAHTGIVNGVNECLKDLKGMSQACHFGPKLNYRLCLTTPKKGSNLIRFFSTPLNEYVEVSPRRFFQLENDIHNISLETSPRLGHQLLTHAFFIFLKEVLGYESVQLVLKEDHFNATGVLNRLAGEGEDGTAEAWGARSGRISDSMINLAVWLSPEIELEEWTDPGYLESCGHLGFPGRFGWFTPNSRIIRENPRLDYWRTYTDDLKLASLFSLSPEDSLNATRLSTDLHGKFYCKESYCVNGAYEPEICRDKDCAVLIASYTESASYLPSQISSLNLLVRVMYVGPNLDPFVRHLHQKYKDSGEGRGVLFFSWKPTLLTTELDLITVSLPPCDDDSFCNYESGKLEKFVWGKLRDGAKLAYEATHRLSLTLEEYTSYLQLYQTEVTNNVSETIGSVACSWMKKNRPIWKTWKSTSDYEKTPLYIGGIFPMTGTYTERGILVAASMATQAVNANDGVLKDYVLRLYAYDGQCRADMVMKSFIDYIRLSSFPHMAGILGPACSDTVEPLAGVARHFKTVVISYSAEGSSFSDREQYPYFFRTIGENKQYQHVYLKLFQELKWGRIASLTEEGQKYAEYVSHLHDLMQENGITFVANRKFPRERAAVNMSQYLQDLKSKKAKIIIGDFYDHAARAVMCEAYRQKMTAREGYVWFLPLWFIDDWYDTDNYNLVSGKETVPCNTSEMVQAINGHLSLQHAYFAPDDSIMEENLTVGEWRKNYTKACTAKNFTTSDYAGYAYDAVWTYAYALDKLLKQNHSHVANLHSEKTTETFVQMINTTDFHGVSGHIKFIGGPSRLSTITVVQWLDRKTTIVGTFSPVTKNQSNEIISGVLHLNRSAIVWLNPTGLIPEDGSEPPPKCVLETLALALDVSCEVAIVIANVIVFGILGLILVVCFIVIKMRYEQRVRKTEDYMKSLGIDMLSVASVSALDKWEIPRDRVVINRKLGEGAFGTVYGGECFSDDKGWVAVAVKTLKMGSTLEQKVDFLSEAEVMKRFEHKNIVKLLGVCTKAEPVYTIMEFMLYGDLKTYLLARRHLVNEKNCEESDEISNKRLTAMTLDVARALSYLAELKYVHRDVACRNCLVNANRVVKLGDFGMTRPMYENDYYRLNRKGMLPVRWMAPESLAVGIFTPASDVWSFGVLLYEIITFGSFPFQGLSNNQVLEVVKAGNIINIPDGVKPQLENLLLSCWAFEPSRRPHSSEVVEFLANNPRIISPCLDIPLASVQLEGADVLEIELPRRRNRKIVRQNTDSSPGGQVLPELVPLTSVEQGCNHRESQSQSHSSPYATLQNSSNLLDAYA